MVHEQVVVGAALDGDGNAVAVAWAEDQGLKDQHVQRALKE